VKNYKKLPKKELIYKILDQQAILPDADLPVAKKSVKPENKSEREEKSEVVTKQKDDDRRRPRVKRENVTDSEKPRPSSHQNTTPSPATENKKPESFLDTFKQEVSGAKPEPADATPKEKEQPQKRESFPKREPIIKDTEADSDASPRAVEQKPSQDKGPRREERKDD